MRRKKISGLEYIIKINCMSLTSVAKDLNMSRQLLHLWAKGKNNIPREGIIMLSEYFQIPEKYLDIDVGIKDQIAILNMQIKNLEKKYTNMTAEEKMEFG